jgi:predicted nucleotidyltransferase
VDIVVEFKKPIGLQFVELADDIEQLLHKKIDLLTLDSLKSIRAKSVAKSIEENIIYV